MTQLNIETSSSPEGGDRLPSYRLEDFGLKVLDTEDASVAERHRLALEAARLGIDLILESGVDSPGKAQQLSNYSKMVLLLESKGEGYIEFRDAYSAVLNVYRQTLNNTLPDDFWDQGYDTFAEQVRLLSQSSGISGATLLNGILTDRDESMWVVHNYVVVYAEGTQNPLLRRGILETAMDPEIAEGTRKYALEAIKGNLSSAELSSLDAIMDQMIRGSMNHELFHAALKVLAQDGTADSAELLKDYYRNHSWTDFSLQHLQLALLKRQVYELYPEILPNLLRTSQGEGIVAEVWNSGPKRQLQVGGERLRSYLGKALRAALLAREHETFSDLLGSDRTLTSALLELFVPQRSEELAFATLKFLKSPESEQFLARIGSIVSGFSSKRFCDELTEIVQKQDGPRADLAAELLAKCRSVAAQDVFCKIAVEIAGKDSTELTESDLQLFKRAAKIVEPTFSPQIYRDFAEATLKTGVDQSMLETATKALSNCEDKRVDALRAQILAGGKASLAQRTLIVESLTRSESPEVHAALKSLLSERLSDGDEPSLALHVAAADALASSGNSDNLRFLCELHRDSSIDSQRSQLEELLYQYNYDPDVRRYLERGR